MNKRTKDASLLDPDKSKRNNKKHNQEFSEYIPRIEVLFTRGIIIKHSQID